MKAWAELTPTQRSLFGPQGQAQYARLSDEQRAVFLLLTHRMEACGVDLSGLRLEDPVRTIRPNRLLFAQGPALSSLQAQLERGRQAGRFGADDIFEPFHFGRGDVGVRENRVMWSLQIGIGDRGAFVDVDRYNPDAGWKAMLGHAVELFVPGKPEATDIARALDAAIFGGRE